MSLDFYIEETKPTEVYWRNITHNVSPMWREAGVYDALYGSEGLQARSLLPFLEKGYKDMEKNPVKYRALNATNGWGTYEHALEFLADVIKACNENLNGTVHISAENMNLLAKLTKLVVTSALIVPALFVDEQDDLLDWYHED